MIELDEIDVNMSEELLTRGLTILLFQREDMKYCAVALRKVALPCITNDRQYAADVSPSKAIYSLTKKLIERGKNAIHK